jgi:hypothetical protein
MVGRPALFVTADLQADETEFASLDEDTHMSRNFELRGLRQGIGTAIAYRYCEETRDENFRKWKSYGRGYRGFADDNPERRHAILKHMFVTVPLVRGWRPVLRGHLTQPVFAGMMAANVYSGWRSAKK